MNRSRDTHWRGTGGPMGGGEPLGYQPSYGPGDLPASEREMGQHAPTSGPGRFSGSYPTGRPANPSRKLVQSVKAKIAADHERERQRRKLVNVLIVAQLLLTLAVALGYIVPVVRVPLLMPLALAVGIYLIAFLTNRFFHNGTLATYILIFGGGLAVTVQVTAAALASSLTDTAHAALFYVVIVLEAGLLFAPEATLITATAATAFTGALLVAVSYSEPPGPQAYLLVVYTLILQAVVGLISWLISQYIFDSAVAQQRAVEHDFTQARFDSLQAEVDTERAQLERSIGLIQVAITRSLRGETARVEPLDGALSDLGQSMNLLLESMEPAIRAHEERAYVEEWVRRLVETSNRTLEASGGGVNTPSDLPIMGNTMDSLSVVVNYLQANNQQRLGRIQALANDISALTAEAHEVLTSANGQVNQAYQMAGASVSQLDSAVKSLQAWQSQLDATRRLLAALLPSEITNLPPADPRAEALDPQAAARLPEFDIHIGIEPGSTGQFSVVEPGNEGHSDIVPLTRPLEALSPDGDTRAGRRKGRAGQLPPELVEAWNLLAQSTQDIENKVNALGLLLRNLSILSRTTRQTEAPLVWVLQALDTISRSVEQMQQTSGAHVPPLDPIDPASSTIGQASRPSMPNRTWQTSRPLNPDEPPVPGGSSAGNTLPPPGSLRLSSLLDPTEQNPNASFPSFGPPDDDNDGLPRPKAQ